MLLFGLAGLFGKWIDLPAATIVFGRTAVAAAALGTAARALPAATRVRFEWRMAVNGAVLAVHWVAFFQAIQIAQCRDRAAGLRELSAVRAAARSRAVAARRRSR